MNRLADWASRPRGIAEWAEVTVSAVVLIGCTLFVFIALHPSKLFLNTLTAGGDMGAHVWAPQFLKSHLFPHGRIGGWAPDWYDGFPALTFYFPGPYTAIALLSYVIPYDVAFKLVSVSGCVFLPVAAYAFGRLIRMRFPGPQLLAIATLPYLFDRYWTIYGGNIASTLAGEFSFEISLCFALLFIGVFARSLETGKYRWLAAVLLAATLLCHLLPAFFAIAGAVIVWLLQPSRRRLGVAVLVGLVGLAVAGFWLIPFALRLGYSNDMGWERSTAFVKGLFPWVCNAHKTDTNVNCPAFNVVHPYTEHLKVVVALAAAGVLGGLAFRRRATLLIAGLGLASAAAFRLMPQGTLWNARMLPFWYLSLYLAAAACLAEAAAAVGVLFGRTLRPPGDEVTDDPLRDRDLAPLDAGMDRELVGAGVGGPGPWGSAPPPWGGAGDAAVPGGSGNGPDAGEGSGSWGPPRRGGPGGGADPPADDLVPSPWPAIITPVLVLLLVLAFIGQALPDYSGITRFFLHGVSIGGADQRANPNFVSSWADWNYSGYQQKPAYPEYRELMSTMARVGRQNGCGRALWEYESEEDRFGTPMALMLLPDFTNGCIDSEEGLFFESSASVPYHFLDQSELSEAPSRAMRDLPYRNFDIVDGISHLQLLGVRYYMAISPAAQAAAQTLTTGPAPLLRKVASTGTHEVQYTSGSTATNQPRTWQVYEVTGSDTVAPLSFEPAVLTHAATTGPGWNKLSIAWYQDQSRWAVPLAASGPTSWPRVPASNDASPPRVPVHQAVVSHITTSDDRISFDVDPETVRSHSPVLVKTSYFPNWQAIGADGPWRVTPNLMVVVPTSTHVELHYGFTPVDNAGRLASVLGLGVVATWWWWDHRSETIVDHEEEDEEHQDDLVDAGGSDSW
ncbi:MAG TPA: hypothetical protein VGI06_17210 [Acidimicrobiales bacterium]